MKEIESLRFGFSRALVKDTISDTHLIASFGALKVAVQLIQRVKDDIQLILSALENSLDSKSAIERITSTRESMFVGFEHQLASLNEQEKDLFHKAKDISLVVERRIKQELAEEPNASCLSADARQELIILRMQLTDIQQLLRDAKAEKFMRRLGNEW